MNKNILIIVIIMAVAALIGAVFFFQRSEGPAPSGPQGTDGIEGAQVPEGVLPAEGDTTSAINQDLKDIDVGGLDQEFQVLDTDLNTL